MSKSAFSLKVFAAYLFLVGTVLVVAPNFLLGLFGLPDAQEVWVRVVGMLALILSYYYSVAAKHELTSLIRASIVGRGSVILFFSAFVLFEWAPPVLLIFGFIDLVAAIWTALSLKADASVGS